MEKRGVVELGVTPSEQSGQPGEVILDGQVLKKDEKPADNTVEKLAALIDTPPRV